MKRRVMAWLAVAPAFLSAILVANASATVRTIDYEVRRLVERTDAYAVTLRFVGDASGRTALHVPSEWASATHAERGIEDLSAASPGVRIEDTGDPSIKHVLHRPGQRVLVRYVLRQITPGAPDATWRTQYLPLMQPEYFAWIGWTTWVVPFESTERARISVRFEDLPADWNFASSFGQDARHVAFEGPIDRFLESIFVAGDFRLRARPVRGGLLIVATRGTWTVRDGAVADRVATIVDGERAFWRDDTQRFFLVTVVPIAAPPGWRSITGTGLTQSFASYVSAGTDLGDLDFLWTHEYFHTWNNRELGQFEEPQARMYWFSEGFTDYYMDLLQLRWGMRTLEQYATTYDEKLQELAESPAANTPNDEIPARFFTSDAIGKLPYLRGRLLAAEWDAQIRTASGGRRSLDELMRGLYDEHARGADVLDERRIVERARAEGVVDPEGDVEREIHRGAQPAFPDGVLGACIAIDDTTGARFDWGFDHDLATQGHPISGTRPDGPAYAAGVRDGQWLRSAMQGRTRESRVEVGVQDLPDETVHVFRYVAKGAPLTRRGAALKPGLDANARSRCLHELGAASSMPVPSTPSAHASP